MPKEETRFTFIPSGHSSLYMGACTICGATVTDYVIRYSGDPDDLTNRVWHIEWHKGNGDIHDDIDTPY